MSVENLSCRALYFTITAEAVNCAGDTGTISSDNL